jgi:hypothetical protein
MQLPLQPATRRSGRGRRGAVAVLVALTVPVLIGFAGLAVDLGMMWNMKRQMQNAADAAAVAAGTQLRRGGNYRAAGKDLSSLNGFTDGSDSTAVTVNSPPASGAFAGDVRFAEVIVAKDQPSYFMRYLGPSSVTIRARAVAGGASGNFCVYALDPTASAAFQNDNAVSSSCGIMVNSNSPTAVSTAGPITAPDVGIVGNTANAGRISGKLSTGLAPAPDPLAGLPAPIVGSCNQTNFSRTGNVSTNLTAGVYCGGITLHGNASVTLGPGTYILLGGGLTSDGNSSIVGTSGVTFYNTYNSSNIYKPIYTQDSNTLDLIAPVTGTYEGILFFQDRSVVSSAPNIIAGGSARLQGALYFPTTPLVLSSQSNVSAAYSIIVARTVSNQINLFSVTSDYSSLTKGSPIQKTVLYE